VVNNETGVFVKGIERKRHCGCLICSRFVCSQCWLKGFRADTREKEGSSRSRITSSAFIPKHHEKVMKESKDGLSGFLPACMIW